ncbi:hypothetical protein Ciccas_000054 [Cichlidogyrus casuarinus]|uniref:DNA sliding clamp PCNA n=1 Tax=Cichlidogyrus casuarinus TaxID=1844966 RepID=A0ABD2QP25_9PLAT
MFEAKLEKADLWRKVIEAMKDLVQEATLDCTDNGISLQAMDNAHVSLVCLLLRSDGFLEYRCDRNVSLGLNIARYINYHYSNFSSTAKILKCAGSTDSITIRAADRADTVSFVFESENNEKVSEFSIKLMDLDVDHLGIPDSVNYKSIIKLPAAEFRRICSDLAQIGDSVVISVSKNDVCFNASGDLGSGNIRLTQTANADKPEDAVVVDMTEPVSMTYSLQYLNYFTKATPLSGQVSLSLSDNVPAEIQYTIPDLGYMRFYLAPKIEDDDN